MGVKLHRGFESRPLRREPVLRGLALDWFARAPHRRASAPVAQLDRASVYGTEGQRFESSRARFESPTYRGVFFVPREGLQIGRTPYGPRGWGPGPRRSHVRGADT